MVAAARPGRGQQNDKEGSLLRRHYYHKNDMAA
jgi:hypothetical protein